VLLGYCRWSIQDESSSWGFLIVGVSGTLFIIVTGAIALSRRRPTMKTPDTPHRLFIKAFSNKEGGPAASAATVLNKTPTSLETNY
jgi:hypothetical protein